MENVVNVNNISCRWKRVCGFRGRAAQANTHRCSHALHAKLSAFVAGLWIKRELL